MATDKTRTFLLFYSEHENGFYISDDSSLLISITNAAIDGLSCDEFLAALFVPGRRPLFDTIFQIQEELKDILNRVIDRLINIL